MQPPKPIQSQRPLVKRIILALVALTSISIGFAAVIIYRNYTAPFKTLEHEIAKMKSAGEPMTFDEILPASIPDWDNAAVDYEQIFALLDNGTEEEQQAFTEFLKPTREQVEETTREAVGRILIKNREALSSLPKATTKHYCQFPVNWKIPIYAQFPHYAPLRQCANLLYSDALLKKARGDVEGALRSCVTVLRMAKQLGREQPPIFIGFFVRTTLYAIALRAAEQILTDTDVSAPMYRALLRELDEHGMKAHLTHSLIAERCVGRSAWVLLAKGEATLEEIAGETVRQRKQLGSPLERLWLARDETSFLQIMSHAISISKQPNYDWEAMESLKVLQEESKSKLNILTAILTPFYTQTFETAAHIEARIHTSRLAIRLRLFRLEHGEYPDESSYAAELPTDPFNGTPFIYRREGNGFIVYSVGRNRKDDDGVYNTEHPNESDIVWRSEI